MIVPIKFEQEEDPILCELDDGLPLMCLSTVLSQKLGIDIESDSLQLYFFFQNRILDQTISVNDIPNFTPDSVIQCRMANTSENILDPYTHFGIPPPSVQISSTTTPSTPNNSSFNLDRLSQFGLTPQDIAYNRSQMIQSQNPFGLASTSSNLSVAEDQFMTGVFDSSNPSHQTPQLSAPLGIAMVNGVVPRTSISGKHSDFLTGLLFGFLFNIAVLFYLQDQSLNKRSKFGIISGILISGILGLFFYFI